jgi:hypothetical protein
MTVSLGYVGAYVVLVGVASFIESPVGRGFGAFQLNVLIRTGSLVAALVALILTHGFAIPIEDLGDGGFDVIVEIESRRFHHTQLS